MKPLIPVLVLSAAVPAVCQRSQRPFQILPPQPTPRVLPQPRLNPFDRQMPAPGLAFKAPTPQFLNPQIDRQMIHRPSQDGQQQPRTPLAKNLYPDLKLLPLEATARLEPIPVYFPKFKLEPIPTTAPDAKMVPIKTATVWPDSKN